MTRRESKVADGATAVAGRPVGRPRVNGRPQAVASPKDEIVAVATRLFAERGFAQTTMSEIARAAGLQQSSLYYWFRRKELILQATFAVNRVSLGFVEQLGAGPGSPGLKLYRLLRFDTRQLCQSPCDINEVERLATLQPDVFADYWRDHQRLHRCVADLVVAGVDSGEFVPCDAGLTASGLLSLDEGMQNWFRRQRRHRTRSSAPFAARAYGAEQVAEFVAATGTRSLLARPSDLARIRTRAAAFDDAPVAHR